MPPPVDALIVTLYFGVLGCLAAYGVHRAYLLYLYTRRRPRSVPPATPSRPAAGMLPRVTVQLPVYNEMYVVERLIDAVGALR